MSDEREKDAAKEFVTDAEVEAAVLAVQRRFVWGEDELEDGTMPKQDERGNG